MLAIESIDGIPLALQPLCDGYSVTTSDLVADGSGRSTETGKTIRYKVRTGVYKLTLKFKGPSEDIAQVDRLVSRFTQKVVFFHGGEYHTANMYPGDRTINDNGMTAELSVNLIEL